MRSIIRLTLALTLLVPSISYADLFDGETFLTFGLSTLSINGANPARNVIFPKGNEATIGGGFPGPQTGISVRALLCVDKQREFRIPIGFDYYYFRGLQRLPDKFYTIYATHTVQVPAFSMGFEYGFLELPLASARVYAGADLRLFFIRPSNLTVNVDYENPDFRDTTRTFGKSAATRLGTSLRIGVDGEISKPWYVNISLGYNVFNLMGRDDARGELFTPSLLSETRESLLGSLIINVSMQYKL
jgi:hypothetical protein